MESFSSKSFTPLPQRVIKELEGIFILRFGESPSHYVPVLPQQNVKCPDGLFALRIILCLFCIFKCCIPFNTKTRSSSKKVSFQIMFNSMETYHEYVSQFLLARRSKRIGEVGIIPVRPVLSFNIRLF